MWDEQTELEYFYLVHMWAQLKALHLVPKRDAQKELEYFCLVRKKVRLKAL